MATDGDIRIDLRGDGRVILYKRDNLKDPVWQVRVRVPNSRQRQPLLPINSVEL